MQWTAPPLNGYDGIDPKDFLTALPESFRADDKPLLIYVWCDCEEATKQAADVEQNVFRDENVALGAKLFNTIEIDGDKLAKSSPWYQTLSGRELPRVIVVDAAGQRIGAVDGKELTASNVFAQMRKAAARSFKTDLVKVVKDRRALVGQMDQIGTRLQVLAEQKKSANAAKEAQIAAEEAKLAEQMTDLLARDADLIERVNQERKVAKS